MIKGVFRGRIGICLSLAPKEPFHPVALLDPKLSEVVRATLGYLAERAPLGGQFLESTMNNI